MLDLDKGNFDAEVLQAEGYVLVDFYGEGCQPCMALAPHLESLEKEFGGRMKFTKLNTTKARRLAMGQKVLGLPVVAVYKDGAKLEELVKDEAVPAKIREMILEYI